MHNAKNYETFKTVDENCEEGTLNVNGQSKAFKIEPGQLETFCNQNTKKDGDQLMITVD